MIEYNFLFQQKHSDWRSESVSQVSVSQVKAGDNNKEFITKNAQA